MLFFNALIRRYTPPTCTLEIWAKRSVLSRWTERTLLKDLRFELRFDDPRSPEAEQMMIQGQQSELELLYDVVTSYVQNFLEQTPTYLFANTRTGRHEEASEALSLTSLPQQAAQDSQQGIPIPPTLSAQGLLAHELFLGSMAAENSPSLLKLSASQLFDLANALEEYSLEATTLPHLDRSRSHQILAGWQGNVAVALITVALTAIAMKIFQSSQPSLESVASRQALESKTGQPNLVEALPPVPPPPLGKPLPSPNLPPSLANRDPLPPPAGVNPSTPPLRNPSVPFVVPPASVLPPPPIVPSVGSQSTIAIAPQSSNLPAGNTPQFSSRRITGAPKLPPLPSISSPPAASVREQQETSETSDQARLTSPKATSTLLDTIPQVTEVRQYFQQRWQTPEGLTQTLEYRLVVNQDGSLKRIFPLGKAANIYLDRTQMPLLGESFVSPLQVKGEQTIRLVLSPNGTVRTFLE